MRSPRARASLTLFRALSGFIKPREFETKNHEYPGDGALIARTWEDPEDPPVDADVPSNEVRWEMSQKRSTGATLRVPLEGGPFRVIEVSRVSPVF